jgi:hypothetical protein
MIRFAGVQIFDQRFLPSAALSSVHPDAEWRQLASGSSSHLARSATKRFYRCGYTGFSFSCSLNPSRNIDGKVN